MTSQSPVYRTINIRRHVLPPRVAYVLSDGPDAVRRTALAIRFAGACWGGGGHVVVPCRADGSIHPSLHRLIEHMNPDYISPFHHTGGEIDELNPGWLDRNLTESGLALENTGARQMLADEVHIDNVAADAADRLCESIPVFRIAGRPTQISATGGGELPGQLTSIEDYVDEPFRKTRVKVKAIEDLSLAARFGSSGIAPVDDQPAQFESFKPQDILNYWQRNYPTTFTPAAQNLIGIHGGSSLQETNLIVFGDTLEDFALSILWDRACGDSMHLPAKPPFAVPALWAMLSLIRQQRYATYPRLLISSCSIDIGHLQQLVRSLGEISPSTSRNNWEAAPPEQLPLGQIRFLASEYQWHELATLPVEDRGSEVVAAAPVKPVRPTFLRARSWTTLVVADEHPVPPHVALTDGELVVRRPGALLDVMARPFVGGIAYSSTNMGLVFSGASDDTRLAAPRPIFPDATTALRIAADKGGCSTRFSQAGVRTRYVLNKWQDRNQLVNDLRDEAVSSILDEFRRVSGLPKDPRDELTFRRNGVVALRWEHLKTLGGGEDLAATRGHVDRLLERGILHRGFVLSCANCSFRFFYELGVIGQSFDCARCSAVNALTKDRWKFPDDGEEPWHWFRLNAVIDEFFQMNGDVSLLAAQALSSRENEAVSVAPEIELLDGDGNALVEFDFAIATSTRLIVGEAKSNDRLATSRKERYQEFKKLLAGAAILGSKWVALATAKPDWHQEFESEIRDWRETWIQGGGNRIEILSITNVRSPTAEAIQMI